MKRLFLFSWAQLMKLVALFKPLLELIKSIIDIFKVPKEVDDDSQ